MERSLGMNLWLMRPDGLMEILMDTYLGKTYCTVLPRFSELLNLSLKTSSTTILFPEFAFEEG